MINMRNQGVGSLKVFPEKKFNEMIEEVGPSNYCIFDRGENLPGDIFKKSLVIESYNSVLAGTGCSASDFTVMYGDHHKTLDVVIPAGSPIMIARLLRYDNSHGDPHYNADDQLFFPSKSGIVYKLYRKDAPDHFIEIAANSNIKSVAEAYNLPEQKSGPVEQYIAKGARLHVNVVPLANE